MSGKFSFLVVLAILILSACRAQVTPTESPQTMEPISTTAAAVPPLTEAEVPRVTVTDAKAAFDSGAAILVDVRSAEAYAASHIPGALHIQLGEFETNPAGLDLDQDKWIITYCT